MKEKFEMNLFDTIDGYINFFKNIKPSKWTTGTVEQDGKRCVLGHIVGYDASLVKIDPMKEWKERGPLIRESFEKIGIDWETLVAVNNGRAYNMPKEITSKKTPRGRVLAYLRSLQ